MNVCMNIRTSAGRQIPAPSRWITLLLPVLLLGTPLGIQAQVVPLPAPAGFEKPAGLSHGGFQFYNRLQLGVGATDNIRLDPSQQSDEKGIIALNAMAQSTWDRHALAFTLSYLEQQARKTDGQDNNTFSPTISGRFDLAPGHSLRWGLLREESIVDQNSPQQFLGTLNGVTRTDTVEAGWYRDSEAEFLHVLARHQEVSNDTFIDVDILTRTQVQDRAETNLTVQWGRTKTSLGQVYLLGGAQQIRYDGSEFLFPENRDSRGLRAGVGVEFQKGDLSGVFRLIGFTQDFEAPSIGTVSSLVGTAQLIRQVDARWSTGLVAQRTFDETNIEGSGGLYTNLFTLAAQYQPRPDLYLKFGPAYRYYQIEGTDYTAESLSFDATLAWQVHPRVELLVNATHFEQTVSDRAFLGNLEYSEKAVVVSSVFSF